MYQIPGDFLMTYNPGATEQHSDSSEFESDVSPNVSRIIGKHRLLDKKIKNKKSFKYYIHQQIFNKQNIIDNDFKTQTKDTEERLCNEDNVHHSELTHRNKKVKRDNYSRDQSKDLNCGDQVEVGKSKVSIIRHKVIPCISHIFSRYSNVKHTMSIIKETLPDNVTKDNGCQAHRGERTRKYNRERCYAVQPVYAVEGITHGKPAPNPFKQTKMTNVQVKRNQPSKNQYSNTSLSLSSSDVPIVEKKLEPDAHRKFKKSLINEIRKEYQQYRFKKHMRRHQEQHYPSKHNNKNVYQDYNTSYQQQTKDCCNTADSDSLSEIPSSRFWDFITDKLSKKYQPDISPNRETKRSCTCLKNQPPQNQPPQNQRTCGPSNCKHYQAAGAYRNSPGNRSPTSITPEPNTDCQNYALKGDISVYKLQLPSIFRKKEAAKDKVDCHCSKKHKNNPVGEPVSQPDKIRACQEPHDQVTEALENNYNRQILCIHSPPCVLINGCLNLCNPKELSEDEVNMWPEVKQNCKKNQYSQQYYYSEQSSQYAAPLLEMVQCQTPEYKAEKLIQSVCNHRPPCEIVRGCYKQKRDSIELDSCSHLPNDKLLQSTDGQKDDRVSENSTQCEECKERNFLLTAREDLGTQVKSKSKMICRHSPPCIMLPRCLARVVYDSCMTVEAIPDCVHRPPCDLIPACCRRPAKGMVS